MSTFLTLSDERARLGLMMAARAESLLCDLQVMKGLLVSLFSSSEEGKVMFGRDCDAWLCDICVTC
jgi:hypothetical protein